MNHGGITGKNYWRSLDELAQTPEFRAFVENEFPNHAADLLDGPSRRQFLKVMGASFALAGLTGCRRWPEEKLAPFAHRPEGRSPGTTLQYATAMELGGSAVGLLVTSYDGRPIKIEGNPLHPASLGSASAIAQASVLELYDPDRSRFIQQRKQPASSPATESRSWDEFTAFARKHFGELKKNGGAGLAVLSEAFSGPSMADMRQRWAKAFPQAKWYEYEPISRDNEREGLKQAFGRPVRMQLHLDKADVVLSLGEDLFGSHPNALRYARDWASRRRGDSIRARSASEGASDSSAMNRLYVAESTYTMTGAVADERFPLRNITSALAAIPKAVVADSQVERQSTAIARDLAAHRGRCIVVAGPDQSPKVHAAVAAVNDDLGNIGQTITLTEEPQADRPSHVEAIKSLTADLRDGKVQTLVILGGNPVYDAPVDLGFAAAMAKVGTTLHLGGYENETSLRCHWHVPAAHYLEAWGDARAWDGTIGVVQPLIEPLYNGKSAIELLAVLMGESVTAGYDIVRRTFAQLLSKDDFEAAWRSVLHDGLLKGSAFAEITGVSALAGKDSRREEVREGIPAPAAPAELRSARVTVGNSDFEIVFAADRKVYDGRFANNGWLQELPDPLTKLAWDNAALISLADANKLGVKTGDIVSIQVGERTLEIAAYIMPGQAAGVVSLPLGYGRSAAGRVGDSVGANTYALRSSDAMYVTQGKIAKTGKTSKLACTQDHHSIDRLGYEERKHRAADLIREVSLPEYLKSGGKLPQSLGEEGSAEKEQLWEQPLKFEDNRWGMAVDLSSCIGCGACVVACQAENNIPIVGKNEVLVGREMHWLRVDRYFGGEPDDPNPQVAYQPMTCHHCENAPCESVCPVAATVHDTDGLNTMVYNRCIGTRYCSNNCPFKVRRFNYFDYHSKGPKAGRLPWLGIPDTQQVQSIDNIRKMGFNPDVTVRMRGVMEKCTFCVQRIQAVKVQAANERRPIADGEVVPACAQTCPTQTIVFGDLNDPNSKVRQLQESNHAYELLDELNIRPRTKYLARIVNRQDAKSAEEKAG